jgi:hypothetical protein
MEVQAIAAQTSDVQAMAQQATAVLGNPLAILQA